MTLPKHCLRMDQLSKAQIETLIDQALSFIDRDAWQIRKNTRCAGRSVGLVFDEASTRTRCSFHMAAHALGAHTIDVPQQTSSAQKGESLIDTLCNLAAMWVDALVVRSADTQWVNQLDALDPRPCVINAGNGADEHPTQALLDALTLVDQLGAVDRLKVVMVGDIKHARTAHSQIKCLQRLGLRDLVLAAPPSLLPDELPEAAAHTTSLAEALVDADVIMTFRMQQERMAEATRQGHLQDAAAYKLTAAHLAMAKPQVRLMHPGPVNWGVELCHSLKGHPASLILKQVGYGVAMRMAILCQSLRGL